LARRVRDAGLDPSTRLSKQLLWLVNELLGFPRHLSQHVGGLVITHHSLSTLVPIENAAMADRTVIQWDKDDLDALGILKVDCLALGMLTEIKKCFDLIASYPLPPCGGGLGWGVVLPAIEPSTPHPNPPPQGGREKYTLATIPPEDPKVYEMI